MIAYYGLFATIAAISGYMAQVHRNRRTMFVAICCILITAMVGLRAVTVGTDTVAYFAEYSYGYSRDDEQGFSLAMDLSRRAGLNFQAFMVVVAAILGIALFIVLKYMSVAPFLSVFMILGTGLFAMAMTGMRQTLAVAIFMVAVVFLASGNRLLFLGLVVAASTFHNSAIVLMPIVFLARVRISRPVGWALFGGAAVAATQGSLAGAVLELFGLSKYDPYLRGAVGEVNPLVIAVAAAIPLAALLFWPADGPAQDDSNHDVPWRSFHSLLFVMSLLNFAFAGIAADIPIATRMVYYFAAFNAVLLANTTAVFCERATKATMEISITALSVLFFVFTTPESSLGVAPYSFYWSGQL